MLVKGATGVGLMPKTSRGWIQIGESRTRAKALAGYSRHLSAGSIDLNPAPRGLQLYNTGPVPRWAGYVQEKRWPM